MAGVAGWWREVVRVRVQTFRLPRMLPTACFCHRPRGLSDDSAREAHIYTAADGCAPDGCAPDGCAVEGCATDGPPEPKSAGGHSHKPAL